MWFFTVDKNRFKKDCKWKKNDCDSSHFEELFTDMGLCYTFTQNDLMVENSGTFSLLTLFSKLIDELAKILLK